MALRHAAMTGLVGWTHVGRRRSGVEAGGWLSDIAEENGVRRRRCSSAGRGSSSRRRTGDGREVRCATVDQRWRRALLGSRHGAASQRVLAVDEGWGLGVDEVRACKHGCQRILGPEVVDESRRRQCWEAGRTIVVVVCCLCSWNLALSIRSNKAFGG